MITSRLSTKHTPPKDISPALLRLVWKKNYDLRCFCAALLNLAVKDSIIISSKNNTFQIQKSANESGLFIGEKTLLHQLFSQGTNINLDGNHWLRLSSSQKTHFEVLMDEDEAFFSSPLVGINLIEKAMGWMWPKEFTRVHTLRKHAQKYRNFLDIARKRQLDPVFRPNRQLTQIPIEMPYIVALQIENRWADHFCNHVAQLLSNNAYSTSLYDLADATKKRQARQQRYIVNRQGL